MAIVVNSDASAFKRTANLPTSTSFSMWGWFMLTTDRNTFSGLLGLADSSGGSPSTQHQIATGSDGTTLEVVGSAGATATLGALSLNTWYFAAMTAAASGAGNLKGYFRLITDNVLTSATQTAGSFTTAAAEFGRDGFTGEFITGRIHACGMADAALSIDELLELSYFHEPHADGIRSLNVFYPTIVSVNTDATIDKSGNARNATATVGALADSPPLIWNSSGPRIVLPAASSGTTDVSIDTAGAISIGGQSFATTSSIAIGTQGQITVSGQAVNAAAVVPVANGQITVAGQSFTSVPSVNISAGQVTVNGQSVALNSNVAFSQGAITVAGQSVTTTVGTLTNIDTAGAVTIAGQGFAQTSGVAIAAGQVTISGQFAGITLSLPILAGAVTIAGQSITIDVLAAGNVAIDAGSITVSGQGFSIDVIDRQQIGSGHPKARETFHVEPDPRQFTFYDLQRPRHGPEDQVGVTAGPDSAFLQTESVKSSRLREALLLLLMV